MERREMLQLKLMTKYLNEDYSINEQDKQFSQLMNILLEAKDCILDKEKSKKLLREAKNIIREIEKGSE